ncbi:hypothetical protein [Aquipseudomonas ullengensis]|uniref:Uncharacterized protein n=1 Tax=Aquipseudomonas ullengensis TaxID=2759166 RepID=A0A7W4LM83_9GAMM|nr:hypothetical protein [Pseudomonas ullengensis]MBB2495746.1 hypothetical protein [Pseudomonas ullengensis]
MSLWSLLNLAPRMRCYALLDNRGICRALRQASSAPEQNGWVEVSAMHLGWIGQQLPLEAVMQASPSARRPLPALAA